jgi:probable F420-dependent oxidoreductase
VELGVFGMSSGRCADPAAAVRIARAAERLGYESLWVGEHVILPDPRVPPSPLAPDAPILDPLIALSHLAGATERVRLGTGIIILPQRNPVVLAKELASLDVLSGGRLIFGIGVGYLRPEFAAIGAGFEDRGRRADEYLEAMRSLWEDAHPEYHGATVDFAGVDAHPRPVQRPLPVVVGGASPAALRRAVERGQGWYGFGLTPEETEGCLERLAEAAGRFVRPDHLGRLEITVTPPIHAEDVDAYQQLGVDRLVLVPSHRLADDELEEWLEARAPADRPAE